MEGEEGGPGNSGVCLNLARTAMSPPCGACESYVGPRGGSAGPPLSTAS